MKPYQTLRVDGVPAETMIQLDQIRSWERLTNVELLVSMVAHRHELVLEQVRRDRDAELGALRAILADDGEAES